jgi:hypothetical protein
MGEFTETGGKYMYYRINQSEDNGHADFIYGTFPPKYVM